MNQNPLKESDKIKMLEFEHPQKPKRGKNFDLYKRKKITITNNRGRKNATTSTKSKNGLAAIPQ